MKPEMDDFSDIEEAPAESRSRAMSWVVLAVAVGGFGALAYYAYNSGSKPAGDGEMLVVEADSTPIKETPADPEGEQFPNKDKTIYDVIAPTDGEKRAEKLLPEPEHPVAATNAEDTKPATAPAETTSTFVASGEAKQADPLDLALSKNGGIEKPAAAEPAKPEPAPAPTNVAEVPVASKATPVPEKSYANPQMINEKPAPKKEEPKAKAEAKPKAEKPAAKSGGTGIIQLGAFKSEAEAKSSWNKIVGKNSDVLAGAVPVIVQAEVKGATYYRLRTTVADAKGACAKLSAKGQACMVAK